MGKPIASVAGGRQSVLLGLGVHRPERVVTNDEICERIDSSDEWIRERTGIVERHVGGSTVQLSIESGRMALEMAGVDPKSIDALVLSTTTPDRTVPASSAAVQNELGLRCGARRLSHHASALQWVVGQRTCAYAYACACACGNAA